MSKKKSASFRRKISDFCRLKIAKAVKPRDFRLIHHYLLALIDGHRVPPRSGQGFKWETISTECGIELTDLQAAKGIIENALTAIERAFPNTPRPPHKSPRHSAKQADRSPNITQPPKVMATSNQKYGKRRGVPPRPIVEFPTPLQNIWDEPCSFEEALRLHMHRHGDTAWHLHRAVIKVGETFDRRTIVSWKLGEKTPRNVESFKILARIERRYRLPTGYFKAKLPHPSRATIGHRIEAIGVAERRRLAWHLPDDFDDRSAAEQEEILDWVRRVVIAGSTEYRRYQAAAIKTRFAIRFPSYHLIATKNPITAAVTDISKRRYEEDTDLAISSRSAPRILRDEMRTLLQFKTSTLTSFGYQRNGIWGSETAAQKVEHLGLLFGALSSAPDSAVQGRGVPLRDLTFGLLAFPGVWDWYLRWREERRGFYTAWEVDMLRVALALTRKDTGWIRQTTDLSTRVRPIADLVSRADVEFAKSDWSAACDKFFNHALVRVKEIRRVARVHRDPFEPILPILEAESPVSEYRKITEEILRLMPDERRYPIAKAEAVRAFLMLRLGMHLGLRQRNLRELRLCPRGQNPTPERTLIELRCGELSWNERESGWQVFIPTAAFKNANSTFFGSKPYRLMLPDLGNLYLYIEEYIERHRTRLLHGATDPKTFFVKTVKASSKAPSYDQNTFYEAWRLAVQRYGIFNPFTGRGAIKGLLPHGPHNIRDVLATHILKKTGSYEQASYAIQDTPDMVAKHYGRFLPQDKAAMAAQILNKVWDAA